MKILILQLARFGDIYSTWPTVRAVRRQNPQAHISIMVRARFQAATDGLNEVDKVHIFDSAHLLSPILNNSQATVESLQRLEQFLVSMGYFDQVINLSFSPLSSYLSHALTNPLTQVKGYTRTSDGYLAIPDEVSSYFHAQVGLDKENRYHVADLFAGVAGVELDLVDWIKPQMDHWTSEATPYLVAHIGASQEKKSYPAYLWNIVFRRLLDAWSGKIVIVGSENEYKKAQQTLIGLDVSRIKNLCGKTKLSELFPLLREARVLMGADSAPVHIAALVDTPVVNLSLGGVNAWETGPKSSGSRILIGDAEMAPELIIKETLSLLRGREPVVCDLEVKDPTSAYREVKEQKNGEQWQLVQAIYTNPEVLRVTSPQIIQALSSLFQYNEGVKELLGMLQPNNLQQSKLLETYEEVLEYVEATYPEIACVVRWFRTERLRILPGTFEEVVIQTQRVHQMLELFLDKITYNQEIESEVQSL